MTYDKNLPASLNPYYSFIYSQDRNIAGTIVDYQTRKPIEGVQIVHSYSDTIIFSNKKGEFKCGEQPIHDDTLFLSHPDYYSNITVVRRNGNVHRKRIKLFPANLNTENIVVNEHQHHEIIGGKIFERNTSKPLGEVSIGIGGKVYSSSNNSGSFSIIIPASTPEIIFAHPDFNTDTLSITRKRINNTKIEVIMNRVVFSKEDTLWLTYKNLIGVAVNEFINGGIGVKYQRFLKVNHAVGVHNSYYYNGTGVNFYTKDNSYTGIKIAPYYRFYSPRKVRNGIYVEAKFITGYFDFDALYYGSKADNRRGETFKEKFWSFGFGVGGGWYNFLRRSNHFVFNLYAGIQYLPMNVSKTKSTDQYKNLEVQRGGWYFYGPGSVVEIKLMFSGLF